MIHIDLNGYKPSEAWINKSEKYKQELINCKTKDERDDIIDKRQAHWGKLKDDLLKFSFGKCWFSEAREIYSYYDVEHFRPKKKCIEIDGSELEGYWWLAFDWENYRICGGVGNTHKGNHFAVIRNKVTDNTIAVDDEVVFFLDPKNKEDVSKLTFNENGEIQPLNPDEKLWSNKQASYTITNLKLNYDSLVQERKRIWGVMNDLITEINSAINKSERDPSRSNLKDVENLKDKAREFIAPYTELSATYRACLKASREEWALNLLTEQLDIKKYCKSYLKEIKNGKKKK